MRLGKSTGDRLKRPRLRPKLNFPLADEARFIKAWFGNPSITGAVSPSGKQLARQMAMQVDPTGTGPVIELGPGTGPVTQALIAHGIAEDRLVLVEFDATFCALLAKRFPRAMIIQGDAYHLSQTLAGRVANKAAAIVSSLPLLLRGEAERLDLLADAFGLMQPQAPYIQFTYGLKSPMPLQAGRGYAARRSAPMLLNLPPAYVWVYRTTDADDITDAQKPDLIDLLKLRTRSMGGKLRHATLAMRSKIVARARKAARL